MEKKTKAARPAVLWVPTSYLAEGIPFAMVIWVSGTMFKDLGHSNTEITLATASVGIMWSLKPLYAGFLDMFRTKKFWVLAMEFLMAVLFGSMAAALALPSYFAAIVLLLWLLAFASATQDICVDGVYITTLNKKAQARWIGWQGAFWVTGRIFATALVVAIAGALQRNGWDAKGAWTIALAVSVATMAGLGLYHAVMLPTGSIPKRPESGRAVVRTFADQWIDFLRKPHIWMMLLFVFLYRSGEGFLLQLAPLFMQGDLAEGGLGLCAGNEGITALCPHLLEDKAWIDGVVSTVVSLVFGIAGGAYAARFGLKTKTLLVMCFFMNVPNLTFVYLSQMVSPEAPLSLTTITVLVTIEKAGYSFGFVANMLYMMQQISPGKYHMTHYAFCTALMNLVLVPTQMASGPLADWMGYRAFFIFVCFATIPSFIAAALAPFPRSGKELVEDEEETTEGGAVKPVGEPAGA